MHQNETHRRPTFGFVARDGNDALFFDVQLQLRVAAAHVLAVVADA